MFDKYLRAFPFTPIINEMDRIRSTTFVLSISLLASLSTVTEASQFWDDSESSAFDETASLLNETGQPPDQAAYGKLTSSNEQCSLRYVHSAAQVTMSNPHSLSLDESSLISYGANSFIVLEPCSLIYLRQQSGLRVQDRGSLHVYARANISGSESGHVTVSGLLNATEFSKLSADASRALIQGQFNLLSNSTVLLYDSSVLRVYEGGYFEMAPLSSLSLYRGAWFQVSEWWQNAIFGHINAGAHFGPNTKITLLDRSSLHVARGNFETGRESVIDLNSQANLFLKGQLNLSDYSSISIGDQARLILGSETRGEYKPEEAPSLVFAAPKINLILEDQATLKILPKTHCIVIGCLRISGTSVWQAGTVVWPSLSCYGTEQEAKNAFDGFQEAKTLCIKVPPSE